MLKCYSSTNKPVSHQTQSKLSIGIARIHISRNGSHRKTYPYIFNTELIV